MRRITADLHVHTALSTCASPEMLPAAVVARAVLLGLAAIAICDHNSAGSIEEVLSAASSTAAGLLVVPGIEITTAEEAHVIGLFPTPQRCLAAAAEVRASMRGASAAAVSLSATGLGLDRTVDLIHEHDGLALAAHVDRPGFSVPGQLGFVPPEVPFDALEISAAGAQRGRAARFSGLGLPLVCSSDAHFLSDMGCGITFFDVESASFGELAAALSGSGGRGCSIA